MTAVRFLGVLAAIGLFLAAVRAYDRHRISRLSLIVVTILSTALAMLSLRPSVFDPMFGWFNVEPGAERRVIFVLVVAVLVTVILARHVGIARRAGMDVVPVSAAEPGPFFEFRRGGCGCRPRWC